MTNARFRVIRLAALSATLFLCSLPVFSQNGGTAADQKPGFLRAEGTSIVDGTGDEFWIRGIAFGNDVWSRPSTPPEAHHSQEDYARIKSLGFNSVRFYLNYQLFEDDAQPFIYKESGFEWIDRNVEWARERGIYLILNMHVPQGGFQSNAETIALWKDKRLQKRFLALWTEIARRYADEPQIAGYSILNEPGVHGGIKKWETFANETVKTIRSVDANHIIIVERMQCEVKAIGNVSYEENANGLLNFPIIDDDNVMYEFHFYEPFPVTHQGAEWLPSLRDTYCSYPGEFSDWDGTRKSGNRDFIERRISRFCEVAKRLGRPLYLGEFGAIRRSFEGGRGGETWVRDVIDVCRSKGINLNYHTYHEVPFGLYYNDAGSLPSLRNDVLAETFAEALAEALSEVSR